MNQLHSLFLSQAYQDCWDDYNRSVKLEKFPCWDYVILTASNEQQAEGFRKQIEKRKDSLPSKTKFAVVPDRDGKRVGSGGATLAVLKYLHEQEHSFDNLRVLVIHSGGDSKRVPQYSALGKLFSPVPHLLPNGRSSTLFDEFMISMSSIPARMKAGMMLLSGDVLLLFNPLQIDYSNAEAAAISFKEPVQTGKNHGVYLRDEDGNVKCCLQKKPVEELRQIGAVNDAQCVDIDTGALLFSTQIMDALYSLVASPVDYDKLVNERTRLSLYADFLYPMAKASTIEAFYQEKPEGEFCPELMEARTLVWKALRPYRMKLLRLAPAKFIHFGTTQEILKLMCGGVNEYKALGWSSQVGSSIRSGVAGYDSVLGKNAAIGENCYLEVSCVHNEATVGENCVLSFVDIHDEVIPSHVVLHGLKQRNGKFIARIFGVQDNPKEGLLFGQSLEEIEKKLGVSLWDGASHTLWEASLYPEEETIQKAVASALNLYALVHGGGDLAAWKHAKKQSLCAGFNAADPDAMIAWNQRMRDLVTMDEIENAIVNRIPAQKLEKLKPLTKIQQEWLKQKIDKADFSQRVRLHYYLGVVLEDENEVQKCFQTIQSEVLASVVDKLKLNEQAHIVMDKHTVRFPLRVNWGGGWSDTPPYCNENGGTVLNMAILLNGEKPVEVTLERIEERKIVFDSRDMDVHGEFDEIEQLQRTGDPFDPFALQKACLLACGIIPKEGHNLKEILDRLGGGFVMHSEVTNVPKGSGLGTSSILSAACVKAVFDFMGLTYTEAELYSHVLAMEQIMSTGGGWQDQVGGMTTGLKYITSRPGIDQQLKVEHVEVPPETQKEMNERFCLIYTGQRRLARNLLRDVIGRYVGNEPDSLFALEEIQKVAALMRFEMERGNVDAFARLLSDHWELSKKVDAGSSNTLIEQIFGSIDSLIDGKLVCGAGGGGFLQVILKKGVTKKQVADRLHEVFMDSLVDVTDCELIWEEK